MNEHKNYCTVKEIQKDYDFSGTEIFNIARQNNIKMCIITGKWLKYLKGINPKINKMASKVALIDKEHFIRIMKEKEAELEQLFIEQKDYSPKTSLEEKLDLLLDKIEEIKTELKNQKFKEARKERSLGDIKFEKDQVIKLVRTLRIYGRKQRAFYKKLEELSGEDLYKRREFERQIALTKGYSPSSVKKSSLIINIILEDDNLRKAFLDLLYEEEQRMIKENLLAA